MRCCSVSITPLDQARQMSVTLVLLGAEDDFWEQTHLSSWRERSQCVFTDYLVKWGIWLLVLFFPITHPFCVTAYLSKKVCTTWLLQKPSLLKFEDCQQTWASS